MPKQYRIIEVGGLNFGGKHYPEHKIDPLSDWHKKDIDAALKSGLIALETSQEKITEDTDGAEKRAQRINTNS